MLNRETVTNTANLILRRGKLPLAALFMATFATATVWPKAVPPPANPLGGPPPSYSATIDNKATVAGLGFVEPTGRVLTLASELSGVIRGVHGVVGAQVKSGDALVELDQREIDARINALEMQLETATIELEEAKESDERLRRISSEVSSRAVAVDETSRRRFAVRKAQSKVSEIAAQLAEATVTKERLVLRAPRDGTLIDVNARVGEYAVPSQAVTSPRAALVRLADLSEMFVRAQFDEEFAGPLSQLIQGATAVGVVRVLGDGNNSGSKTENTIALVLERVEPRADTKLSTSPGDPRVDTRVIEALFKVVEPSASRLFVGQRVDVFITGLPTIESSV